MRRHDPYQPNQAQQKSSKSSQIQKSPVSQSSRATKSRAGCLAQQYYGIVEIFAAVDPAQQKLASHCDRSSNIEPPGLLLEARRQADRVLLPKVPLASLCQVHVPRPQRARVLPARRSYYRSQIQHRRAPPINRLDPLGQPRSSGFYRLAD